MKATSLKTLLVWLTSAVLNGATVIPALAAPPMFEPFVALGPDDGLRPAASSFDVTSSGAATWRMAFEVPPGRRGMAPAIGIAYSSQSGSGLLGLGFSITGLSSVSRCWTTPAQDGMYRPNKAFPAGIPDAYCLDGQRIVPRMAGDYTLEFDPGTLIKAVGGTTEEPDYFIAKFRDGRIASFGARDEAANGRVRAQTVVVSTSRATTR